MRQAGITLIEALVTVTILVTLIMVALPRFGDLLARQRATADINTLLGAVHTARHAAISQGRKTALCAGRQACLGRNDWHLGMLIFADLNSDGDRQPGEPVVRALAPLHDGARVYWRSFQNKAYLRFRPNGMTDWQNGSFIYCPANGDPRLAKRMIVNVQGRVAKSADTNGDGIDEDGRGRPLRCA